MNPLETSAGPKTPEQIADYLEYGFYRRNRNDGVSYERMCLHFPELDCAGMEACYQQEQRGKA